MNALRVTHRRIALALLLALVGARLSPRAMDLTAATYYVAPPPVGSDLTGSGSSSAPWATITHALESVPDGSTVLVRPGEYRGRREERGIGVIGDPPAGRSGFARRSYRAFGPGGVGVCSHGWTADRQVRAKPVVEVEKTSPRPATGRRRNTPRRRLSRKRNVLRTSPRAREANQEALV